jgi:iron complex transport system substrate-binding protein
MTKKFVLLLAVLFGTCCCSCQLACAQAFRSDQRALTDMAGRTVVVPKKIHSVLGMSPVGTVLVYTLSPELLAGWNYQPDPGELAFYQEPYRHLPVLGGWYGKNNTGNLETIIQAHPDVLISMGDPMGIAIADRVQQQTHIPVFYLDGSLEKLPDAYLKAGELLGNPARAAELATECRRTLDEISKKVATIPASRRRRVYYAEGPTGLETEPGNSMHSEALIFAGAVNVAAVPSQQGYGHTPVSMEQILQWNPDVVISGYDHTSSPGEFYRSVWSNDAWRMVRAVKNHEVYEVPQYPFNWMDRPPSVNRIIGIKWAAHLLYPDLFPYDMRAETRRFYATFYHWNLTDAELNQILATATRKTQ